MLYSLRSQAGEVAISDLSHLYNHSVHVGRVSVNLTRGFSLGTPVSFLVRGYSCSVEQYFPSIDVEENGKFCKNEILIKIFELQTSH